MKLMHLTTGLVACGLSFGAVGTLASLQDNTTRFIAEASAYQAAVEQFKDRYHYWPGDMPNATDIWGIAGGDSGTSDACYNTNSRTLDDPKRTCDGDGSGRVDHLEVLKNQSAPEWFRAWQHLANAELIDAPKGGFTGIADRPPRGATAGKNVPASQVVDNTGYTLMSYTKLNHPMWFPGDYFGFAIGKSQSTNLNLLEMETRGPSLPNALAIAADMKVDDGNPRTGNIRSWRDLPTCVIRDHENDSYSYRTDYPKAGCAIFWALRAPGGEDIVPNRP